MEGCSEAVCCKTETAGVGCWAVGCSAEGCLEAACYRTAGVGCWADCTRVAGCLGEPCACSQPTSSIGLLQIAIALASLAAMLAPQAAGKLRSGGPAHVSILESLPQEERKLRTPTDTPDSINNDIHGSRRRPGNLAGENTAALELQGPPPVAGLCRRRIVRGWIGGRRISASTPTAAAAVLRRWITAAPSSAALLRRRATGCRAPTCATSAAAEAYT